MLLLEDRIENFKTFMGVYITRELLAFLENNNFFTAPASTKYHGNYEGGLFDHSMAVAENLVFLTERNNLKWKSMRSPYIVGMFHDICKIDAYKRVDSNIFVNGIPIDYHYEHNNDLLLPGHGEKSIIYLQPFIDLTEEEIMCIRWHMGAFDEKQNWNYFSKAIEKYSNVLWTHTADMIASKIVGV